jgi:hypothetical protein
MLERWCGHYTTDEPEALTAFLARAHTCYHALSASLAPLRERLTDLEGDWQPRAQASWQETIARVTAVRAALQEILALFDPAQSTPAHPTPLLIAMTAAEAYGERWAVQEALDEALILLTAYLPHCHSQEERSLRLRQRVVAALRALLLTGADAVQCGQRKLAKAPEEDEQWRAALDELVISPPARLRWPRVARALRWQLARLRAACGHNVARRQRARARGRKQILVLCAEGEVANVCISLHFALRHTPQVQITGQGGTEKMHMGFLVLTCLGASIPEECLHAFSRNPDIYLFALSDLNEQGVPTRVNTPVATGYQPALPA